MRFALPILPALLAVAVTGSQDPTLRVLRVTPADEANPTAVVTITFDRPVAGALDRSVDPSAIFRIEPAVPGRVEWRDPITIRFRPDVLLESGVTYAVTVANDFAAMDGSRLRAPYRFTFVVRGARVLTAAPAFRRRNPQFVVPRATFDLVVATPVDLRRAAGVVSIELDRRCAGPRVIRVRPLAQRAIRDSDSWEYKEAGGWDRDRSADSLRRVVTLQPEQPLPLACSGAVVAPLHLEPGASDYERWPFATYGPLRVVAAQCAGRWCPTGPAVLRFSTPVRGAQVLRHVTLLPATAFTVRDTGDVSDRWALEATLKPRTGYAVTVDTALRDVFDQPLGGNPVVTMVTTGYEPSVSYPTGAALVERQGYRTIAVQHVNVDTLLVTQATVPESLEARVLGAPYWRANELWPLVADRAVVRRLPVSGTRDVPLISAVQLPAVNAARPGATTLVMLRITHSGAPDSQPRRAPPTAVLQVTDLAVHARIGAADGSVWVTSARDGTPRPGATVTFADTRGRVRGRATTDARGLARLTGLATRDPGAAAPEAPDGEADNGASGVEGYVAAVLGTDRAVVAVDRWGNDLSPWRFNVAGAYGADRLPAAAAVFTERGIYRPGETVHAKAIVRTGPLGALAVPPPSDSLRWTFLDRDGGTLRDTTVVLSSFGTADQALALPATLPLGTYPVLLSLRRDAKWTRVAATSYRAAEYRPPEFLVDVTADSGPYRGGDSLGATIEARYLFGAPMARAALAWDVRQRPMTPWELDIPGTEGYTLGESGWWWEDASEGTPVAGVVESGRDTLDDRGRARLHVALPPPQNGRPARATVGATVTDVNRQTVSAARSVTVHPAAFYIAARALGASYFWTAGREQRVAVLAVRPDGQRAAGVRVQAVLIRREWHRVQRERDGWEELVGEWVSDTVARCAVTTAADPTVCRFTPDKGGTYVVRLSAEDPQGRAAITSFYRWAVGPDWVPWSDESQFKMDVIPDRTRYSVGDTATLLVAAPFTDVEGWFTVEREGILEERRLQITSGTTTLRLPITERYAPNVFVSVLLTRGRSAAPGSLADPGRPTIRVGYAELRVTPEVKRLSVDVTPLASEYRPADSARVRLRVRDATGTGRRAEVTLWAVDEGVLALTGYVTPDPLDLLYQRRGLGVRLASDLTTVAPQVIAEEGVSRKDQAPGGGGGAENADVLRSRFSSTAFFLASVLTDDGGDATVAAKLPDNLTTFRLMAVAVTAGDRYGSGQSPMLVTRPLLARPALPRFLRPEDRFRAGVVVNHRLGGTPRVAVSAEGEGLTLDGPSRQTATLAAGRGREVRFAFRDPTADTATLRFHVSSGREADAVETRLAVRPAHHPRGFTAAGMLRDTGSIDLVLPGDVDPRRSRLELTLGASPLAVARGAYARLRVYPYYCTEQVASIALPLALLLRAEREGLPGLAPTGARRELEQAVATVQRRQRTDGGIGLWAADDWTTPFLTAHAGALLVEARAAGVAVSDSVLAGVVDFLRRSLHEPRPILAPVARWLDDTRGRLAERVAAADLLSRLGQPDLPAEHDLLRTAPQMAWEDRVRLAGVLARRGDGAGRAARQILEPIWSGVRVEGRRAVVTDSARRAFYFPSPVRPTARLLAATAAVDSTHPLIAPLIETLLGQLRVDRWGGNTQDWASALTALAAFQRTQRRATERPVRVATGGRPLLTLGGVGQPLQDSSLALAGLLAPRGDSVRLRLQLAAGSTATGDAPAIYWVATVRAVPRTRPITPDQAGIEVERWYEDYTTGRPVTSVAEGDLVRVRLRITLAADRQFLVLDDPLPAGLEAIDLSLRTTGLAAGPGATGTGRVEGEEREAEAAGDRWRYGWYYGRWDAGWWSPFDHRELRDDRVIYAATFLWKGTYTASYLARATTPGTFVRAPAHAEEMYNPAVRGRSDGGLFTVTAR